MRHRKIIREVGKRRVFENGNPTVCTWSCCLFIFSSSAPLMQCAENCGMWLDRESFRPTRFEVSRITEMLSSSH